jgi:hypothetical protein
MQQKWKIPELLCEAVIQAVDRKGRSGKYVLDLFAGGQSYQAAVEAAGYDYIPVDIHLCKPTGLAEQKLVEGQKPANVVQCKSCQAERKQPLVESE